MVSSSEVENSKPAPDIFELALERAGSSPEEAVAVGDAVWDVESANEVGIRTVAVLSGGAFSEEELKDAGAVAVYNGCAEILFWLPREPLAQPEPAKTETPVPCLGVLPSN
ncbi:MAG: HAD-IA family hydrolase [Actinomycetota bacterium]|nr:HAD-IA family hydrolase [Actinomycetota bacterium]